MTSARRRATLIGLTAVLMWSTLGVLTAASGAVPPFLMNALCFGVSGLVATIALICSGCGLWVFRQPWPVWALGVGGLFGYHALYFTALRNAPPVAANLLNYLWPLLIVLFSGLLPGEKLKPHHLAGVGLGFIGAALLVTRSGSLGGGSAIGYGAAFAAALVWSTYSVLSRRRASVPTATVAAFCLVTAALSTICHLLFETTIWPASGGQWIAVAALALFPVGAAFFAWDHGVKHGDIQVLGAAAYGAPLISTLLLILFGYGALSGTVTLACLAITGGALVAAKDMLSGLRQTRAAPFSRSSEAAPSISGPPVLDRLARSENRTLDTDNRTS
jgi:drug/metabolite transporter (DMT)-like permease